MAEAPTEQKPELSGSVLMYQSPEPLNLEQHRGLGLNPTASPFGFASKVNAVPLQVTEFPHAAVNYPIIFAGDQKQPLAVLGIRDGENLFVSAEGASEPGAYIPAFIRRYPFVLANDQQGQRMVVCIDRAAPQLVDGGEVKLFENDKPTEYTQRAMKFCEDFEQERLRTESFVKLLSDLDLFEVRQTHFTPNTADGTPGKPVAISEYYAVTEERLNKLSAEKLKELRDNGALGQIYAHLVSLNGWEHLMSRAVSRGPLEFIPADATRN